MNRFLSLLLIILLLLTPALAGCGKSQPGTLTLDTVEKLAQKGDALGWKDLAPYESQSIGSGLYILWYPIDEHYSLMAGAAGPEGEFFYVKLVDSDTEESIDIRWEDVQAFIAEGAKDTE